ncbi:MAG: response regulator [Armatimonadota bacterium]|jgi:two-component system chemotaxis response regulator CheY
MSTINALVIDDSGIMRKMVMRGLEEAGLGEFEFAEAEDGQDGLAKFNPRSTDIVFVDWNMPNMNGMEMVRKVRAQHPDRPVAIVMVTTEKLTGKVEEALDGGVDAFISKPFTPEGLQKRVGPLIDRIVESKGKKGGGFFKRLVA